MRNRIAAPEGLVTSMQFVRLAKLGLIAGLASLAALSASETVLARPKPPPVVETQPPPPPMPEVSLARHFVADAGAFDDYMHQAASVSPAFADAGAVGQSLRAAAAYEPGQLRAGMVAYGAIAALTDNAFVADVRRAGATPEARYAIVTKIFTDPKAALAFADSGRAAGLAKQAIVSDAMRLYDQGNAVKLAAYSIQHQPWSLQTVPDLDTRGDSVKRLSSTQRSVPGSELQTLDFMIAGQPTTPFEPAPPRYSALVVRAVALAALASIGQATDEDAPRLGWLTDDYYVEHCLAEAKLSLFECLAVARPNYEDVFCLGQHAMKDTGGCTVIGAGGAVPIDIVVKPLAIPSPHAGRTSTAAHHRRRTH
jgi:hypothetical protein